MICFLDDLLVVFRKPPPVTISMVLRSMGREEKGGQGMEKHEELLALAEKVIEQAVLPASSSHCQDQTLNLHNSKQLRTTLQHFTTLFNHTLSCSKCPLFLLFMLLSHDVETLTVLKRWRAKWPCQACTQYALKLNVIF